MAFSQDDLDKIEQAIASGALEVRYKDKSVKYNSLSDLLKARDLIKRELGHVTAEGQRILPKFSKGLNG